MKRIIVTELGPIDEQYRPVLSSKPTHHSQDKTSIDLDLIGNDDNLFGEGNGPQKSANRSGRYWSTTDSIKPYFMKADPDSKITHLWVKGSTVSTQSEANSTILYDPIDELQRGDTIRFKKNPNDDRYYWRNEDHDQYSNFIEEGTAVILNRTHNGRKLALSTDSGDIDYIYCRKYNITRAETQRQSKLFSIHSESEIYLIAQYLKSILPLQPWLNIIEIASFLDHKYQRDIYFDHITFQSIVSSTYDPNANHKIKKACTCCTYWSPPESLRCRMCNTAFGENRTNQTSVSFGCLDVDECYAEGIIALAHRGHSTFPSEQRNKLYSKPFLPNIPNEERVYLNAIKARMSALMRTNGTRLYKYQLHTVLWCYVMEQAIAAQCKFYIGCNDLRFTNEHKCNVYTINDAGFIPSDIPHVLPPRRLTFKGGIIADDVGLGKTFTMLSLVATDDYSSMFDDTGRIKTELGPNGKSIRSAATLLIVPARLIEQWKLEILKHFNDETFNVIAIMTTAEHKRMSYEKLLRAHIVLVADEFLENYASNVDEHWREIDPALPPEPVAKKYNLRSKPRERYQDLNLVCACFELIHWKRIVLDEAHEIVDGHRKHRSVLRFVSDFNWYISATPFPKDECVAFAGTFLGINFEDGFYQKVSWSHHLNQPLGFVLHSVMLNHLYSRHTTDSILDDNYLPNIEQTVEFVDLHPIERLLYELTPTRKENVNTLKRRICCGIYKDFRVQCTDNDCVDIDKYDHYLKHIFMENKRNCLAQITETQKQIQDEKKDLKLFHRYLDKINRKKREFEAEREEFTLHNAFGRGWERYRNIDVRIKASRYRIDKMKRKLSRYETEYAVIQKHDDDTFERNIQTFENQFDDESLIKIVSTYGSKQAMILKYIRALHKENEENHIIIFSSFNETLNQMKERLDEIGLDCVICRGTVYTQRKAIRGFKNVNLGYKQQRARIILLSVKDRASGTDLNCATHVILIDPVPGSCSESFAAERQAIGRAVRQGMSKDGCCVTTKVIRFVVKDTIEYDTYQRNVQIREKLIKNDANDADIKLKLNHYLKAKRTQNEIDFYMNINAISDENVNQSNVDHVKMQSKKRLLYSDGDDDINTVKPPMKRRKL